MSLIIIIIIIISLCSSHFSSFTFTRWTLHTRTAFTFAAHDAVYCTHCLGLRAFARTRLRAHFGSSFAAAHLSFTRAALHLFTLDTLLPVTLPRLPSLCYRTLCVATRTFLRLHCRIYIHHILPVYDFTHYVPHTFVFTFLYGPCCRSCAGRIIILIVYHAGMFAFAVRICTRCMGGILLAFAVCARGSPLHAFTPHTARVLHIRVRGWRTYAACALRVVAVPLHLFTPAHRSHHTPHVRTFARYTFARICACCVCLPAVYCDAHVYGLHFTCTRTHAHTRLRLIIVIFISTFSRGSRTSSSPRLSQTSLKHHRAWFCCIYHLRTSLQRLSSHPLFIISALARDAPLFNSLFSHKTKYHIS